MWFSLKSVYRFLRYRGSRNSQIDWSVTQELLDRFLQKLYHRDQRGRFSGGRLNFTEIWAEKRNLKFHGTGPCSKEVKAAKNEIPRFLRGLRSILLWKCTLSWDELWNDTSLITVRHVFLKIIRGPNYPTGAVICSAPWKPGGRITPQAFYYSDNKQ